jgi:uncharacterized protein with ParB-like and HNH nuclease domain
MKASETEFKKIIEGTTQFFVPHYQRAYSWQQKQWAQLWDDLVGLTEDRANHTTEGSAPTHFIGSMVTIPGSSVPQGVAKYVLIDGQQRITTLMILLAALRDLARERGQSRQADMVHNLYLTNQYQEKLEHYKLLPTQGDETGSGDRLAFINIVDIDGPPPIAGHLATNAYEFFAKRIRLSEAPAPEILIATIASGMMIVSIVLDRDDNPYTIFESLNAKGQPLSQADLIRNYFFMRIHQDEHEQVHKCHWQPMERLLKDVSMTEFFRQYLMREGTPVKIDAVYVELKRSTDRRTQLTPAAQLQELHRYAGYYSRMINPESESNLQVRVALASLQRLNFGVTASFLLNIYDDFASGRIEASSMARALAVVENYLLRRFVCGVPTNLLSKMFPALYRQSQDDEGFNLERFEAVLAEKGYPTDEEFRARLESGRMYGGGDRREKTKFILDRLEQSFAHKEPVSTASLTIEHVMPQTITPAWRAVLGPDVDEDFDDQLHRLGNLTLTGYNGEMSNAPYAEKREQLLLSHIELNRYFTDVTVWDFDAIECRSQELANRALSLWPSFRAQEDGPARPRQVVTGTKPTVLHIHEEKHAVKDWSDVLEEVMKYVCEAHPDQFPALRTEFPNYITEEPSGLRSMRKLSNGYFYEANMSAQSIYRLCQQVLDIVGCGGNWSVDTRS